MVVVAVVVAVVVGVAVAVVVGVVVAVVVVVVVAVEAADAVGMSDRTQEARERAEATIKRVYSRFVKGTFDKYRKPDELVHAEDVLLLADRVAALETALRDLRDAALPVVISYENCKAWAEAVGDKWVGVPDVENLAAALAGGGGQTETPA